MLTGTEYDIIFAGGGTSACVIAGRLAAADPSLRLLVLEAGPHTRGLDAHRQPARYPIHLHPTSKTATFNVSKPIEELGDRTVVVPSAHCVGGGSSINLMMYTRGSASDYDDWETVHGNGGWGSKDLIPLFEKTETYQVEPNRPTHGYSGPLKVSYGGSYSNVSQQFLEVARKYDLKRGHTDDPNGLYTCNAYARWPKWIDKETGTRSDVPHHFIYNQEHNKNLKVLDGRKVVRVIFQHGRAVGVEYIKDIVTDPAADQTKCVALASKLVVVSAGAFGSPTILERSGIGSKGILEKYGVNQIVDLPGVGENYQDHTSCFIPYYARDEADTLDAIHRDDTAEIEKSVTQWINGGKGSMAQNGVDAGIKYRPSPEELQQMGPEFRTRWNEHFVDAPDKPVILIAPIAALLRHKPVEPGRKYFVMCYYTEYPMSVGRLHITSGQDPYAAPDFEPGFLIHAADLAILRFGFKRAREYARRMPVFDGELISGNPVFAEGSSAAYKDTSTVHVSAPDIIYSAEDDKAIDAYCREFVQTTWHSLGTCAMKPREKGGVVDSNLNVYGTKGLKVADLSIAPSNVGANTYSTALVIGEKAALIIARELGFGGV